MSTDDNLVHVYWRPGCGACSALRVGLAEAGVVADWHNIWEEKAAAEFVRSVANGNETVPTLVVDGRPMVAPSSRAALREIAATAPHLVLRTRRWTPLRIGQWLSILTMLVLSVVVSRAGYVGWSYVLDGLAVAAYIGIRRLRARAPQAHRSQPDHEAGHGLEQPQ